MIAIYVAVTVKIFQTRRNVDRLNDHYRGSANLRDIWVTRTFAVHSVDEDIEAPGAESPEHSQQNILPADDKTVEPSVHPLTKDGIVNTHVHNSQSARATFDAATMAYFRFGVLYTIAVLATWVRFGLIASHSFPLLTIVLRPLLR